MSDFIKDTNEKIYVVTLYYDGDCARNTSLEGCYTTLESAKERLNILIDDYKPSYIM